MNALTRGQDLDVSSAYINDQHFHDALPMVKGPASVRHCRNLSQF